MSVFFFVSFLALWIVVLMNTAVVKVTELVESLRRPNFRIIDERTVIQGNQWQYLVHLFLSVVGIHVVSANLVFVGVVLDDPVASGWKKSNCFSNAAEDMLIDHDSSLSYLLLTGWLSWLFLLFCFDGGAGALVSKDIVLLLIT